VRQQKTWLLNAERLEDEVVTKVDNYMTALSHAQIPPPMLVLLGGVRMHQTRVIGNPVGPVTNPEPLRNSDLHLPAVRLEDFGELADYRKALKPIFDAVWNAADYEGSASYDADGNWTRRR